MSLQQQTGSVSLRQGVAALRLTRVLALSAFDKLKEFNLANRRDREEQRFLQEQRDIRDGVSTNRDMSRMDRLRERHNQRQSRELRSISREMSAAPAPRYRAPNKTNIFNPRGKAEVISAVRPLAPIERASLPTHPLHYPEILHTPRVKGPGYPTRKR